jgi:hypothetical protein
MQKIGRSRALTWGGVVRHMTYDIENADSKRPTRERGAHKTQGIRHTTYRILHATCKQQEDNEPRPGREEGT